MSLTHDDVHRLARLARIAIDPADEAPVIEALNRVIGLIDVMQAADTAGVEPLSHALEAAFPAGQRLRADEVTELDARDRYLAVAPSVAAGLYLVPLVID